MTLVRRCKMRYKRFWICSLTFMWIFRCVDCPGVSKMFQDAKECPGPNYWSERAKEICPKKPEEYHCMYTQNCNELKEFCEKPQNNDRIELYYLQLNGTNGFKGFYKKPVKDMSSNDTSYHNVQRVFCGKDKEAPRSTEETNTPLYIALSFCVIFGMATLVLGSILFRVWKPKRVLESQRDITNNKRDECTKLTQASDSPLYISRTVEKK